MITKPLAAVLCALSAVTFTIDAAAQRPDDGVDVIADIGNSAVGLGVQELARNRRKLVFFAGASSSAFTAAGGKVLWQVRHPSNTSDFSSFLMQAGGSKADAVALANAVTDTTNSIKQWNEFQMGA